MTANTVRSTSVSQILQITSPYSPRVVEIQPWIEWGCTIPSRNVWVLVHHLVDSHDSASWWVNCWYGMSEWAKSCHSTKFADMFPVKVVSWDVLETLLPVR